MWTSWLGFGTTTGGGRIGARRAPIRVVFLSDAIVIRFTQGAVSPAETRLKNR
jgi:hypothetical protein